jgi:hypothetical protein
VPLQLGRHTLVLVVDRRVEAEFLGDPCALVRTAGDADDPAAVDPGQLTGDASAGGGRDETVSPGSGRPMSNNPKYAVRPVPPSAPRYVGRGATCGSSLRTPRPSETAYSCTPNIPETRSSTAKPACFEATTRPSAIARMTAPMPTGSRYDRPAFIQPRIAGSIEMWVTSTTNSPSPG